MSLRETFFKPLAKLFTNQWSDPEPNIILDPDLGKNNSNLDPEDGISGNNIAENTYGSLAEFSFELSVGSSPGPFPR